MRIRCSASVAARSNSSSRAVTMPARSIVRRSGSSRSSTPPITRKPSCSCAALTVTAHMPCRWTRRPAPRRASSSTGSCAGAGPVRLSRRPVSSIRTTQPPVSSASAAVMSSTPPPGEDHAGEPVVRGRRALVPAVGGAASCAAESASSAAAVRAAAAGLDQRHRGERGQRPEQRHLVVVERARGCGWRRTAPRRTRASTSSGVPQIPMRPSSPTAASISPVCRNCSSAG